MFQKHHTMMTTYPNTSRKPKLNVTGVTIQEACEGMPIIITTEM